MPDLLTEMAAGSRRRAAALVGRPALDVQRAPPLSPRFDGFALIAEVKRRSPAQGLLAGPALDVVAQATAYANAGAACVSVLTEPDRFDGSLEDLRRVARALRPLGVPVLRKDFLVEPAQVDEAADAGASGVLLIARMLSAPALDALLSRAHALGLFTLTEAFDASDARVIRDALAGRPGTHLVGVNCRDLVTLSVEPDRFPALLPELPPDRPAVAESGLQGPQDAARVAAQGYDAALVGTALMRRPTLAAELLTAARAAYLPRERR